MNAYYPRELRRSCGV